MAEGEADSYLDAQDELLVRSPSYMDAIGVNRGQLGIHHDTASHHHPEANTLGNGSAVLDAATQKLQRTASMASIDKNSQPPAPAPGTKSRDTNPNYPDYFHPLDQNLWSFSRLYNYLTFSYLNMFMRLGSQRQLNPDDLYPVPSLDEAYLLTENLETAWKAQLDKPDGNLFKAFVSSFHRRWIMASTLLLIEAILQVIEPFFLGRIISSTADEASDEVVYSYTAALFAAVLV
jgi:hypothetical protein